MTNQYATQLRYWTQHPAGQVEPMRADMLNAADEIERLNKKCDALAYLQYGPLHTIGKPLCERHGYIGDCPWCENERLRARLNRIADGPPGYLPNDEVASWAADQARLALGSSDEPTPKHRCKNCGAEGEPGSPDYCSADCAEDAMNRPAVKSTADCPHPADDRRKGGWEWCVRCGKVIAP